MSSYCAEVLSKGSARTVQDESGAPAAVAGDGGTATVKALVISETPDGFLLERFTDRGQPAGTTQHEIMDDAMSRAYSDYDISAWKFCPDGVDPLEYIRAQSES